MSSPAGSGLPPGGTSQTSCGNWAAGASKCQVTTSPAVAVTVVGSHKVPAAATSCVSGSGPGPPSSGSVADSVTSTGPLYVPPSPGSAGSSSCVVTGSVVSSPPAIENETVLAASRLPATSVERYSIEYAPAAVNTGGSFGSYGSHSATNATSETMPN